jgi:hypothetical protein
MQQMATRKRLKITVSKQGREPKRQPVRFTFARSKTSLTYGRSAPFARMFTSTKFHSVHYSFLVTHSIKHAFRRPLDHVLFGTLFETKKKFGMMSVASTFVCSMIQVMPTLF